jgi:uncharacterized protein
MSKLETLAAPGVVNETALIATICAALPNAMAIYAFGSRVQGTANAQSDLDLAVLAAGYAEPLVLWQLSGALADLAGCAVDLLDLRAASTVMQHQVLSTSRRLYLADGKSLAVGQFECFVSSEKMALDVARAGLLADIAREGRVYGR